MRINRLPQRLLKKLRKAREMLERDKREREP